MRTWKFSLVNYNAGPGCLGEAVPTKEWADLEWLNVAANLNGIALGADYVSEIGK
jgi:hypothetical protein